VSGSSAALWHSLQAASARGVEATAPSLLDEPQPYRKPATNKRQSIIIPNFIIRILFPPSLKLIAIIYVPIIIPNSDYCTALPILLSPHFAYNNNNKMPAFSQVFSVIAGKVRQSHFFKSNQLEFVSSQKPPAMTHNVFF
jgi:hypothetical protein